MLTTKLGVWLFPSLISISQGRVRWGLYVLVKIWKVILSGTGQKDYYHWVVESVRLDFWIDLLLSGKLLIYQVDKIKAWGESLLYWRLRNFRKTGIFGGCLSSSHFGRHWAIPKFVRTLKSELTGRIPPPQFCSVTGQGTLARRCSPHSDWVKSWVRRSLCTQALYWTNSKTLGFWGQASNN